MSNAGLAFAPSAMVPPWTWRRDVLAGAGPAIILFGASSIATTPQPRFLFPGNSFNLAPTSAYEFDIPEAGELRRMTMRAGSGGTTGARSITYTVRVNGVDTALAITASAPTQTAANLVDRVPVASRDRIAVRATKDGALNSSPTEIVIAFEFGAPLS